MKNNNKVVFLALLLAIILLCSACSSDSGSAAEKETVTEVPVILNQAEYVLYQNIFYNNYGPQYENMPVTKNGVFAVIQDAWAGKARYYVWGYLDNTQCCDWQWEFVPKDTKNLPPVGSLITVSGTFAKEEAALDGYWIKDADVGVVKTYAGATAELHMLAMSDTLERVQLLNIMYWPEAFEGKAFTAYGRIAGPGVLQDPYYDGSWEIPFSSASDLSALAIGTSVTLNGKVSAGTLGDCAVTIMQ